VSRLRPGLLVGDAVQQEVGVGLEPGDLAYLVASTVHGSRRVRFVQSPATGPLLTDLADYVDDKSVVPVIEAVYPLDDIVAAHRSLEKSGGFGKRVIEVA
jgi:NADPH:quinone reductase-like Zn-dependent oxidoreductase